MQPGAAFAITPPSLPFFPAGAGGIDAASLRHLADRGRPVRVADPRHGDLLGQVREQVDAPAKPCAEGKKDRNKKDGNKDDDCDALGDDLAPLVGEALLAPFVVPPLALGDDYQTTSLFPRFPYAYGQPGFLWLDRAGDDDSEPRGGRNWSVRADVEDGYDFRGVNRLGTRLVFDTTSRFGIATDWDFFTQRLPCGCYDELTLGDANLTFRFAQSEWMQMYAGLGGRVMPDRSRRAAASTSPTAATCSPASRWWSRPRSTWATSAPRPCSASGARSAWSIGTASCSAATTSSASARWTCKGRWPGGGFGSEPPADLDQDRIPFLSTTA